MSRKLSIPEDLINKDVPPSMVEDNIRRKMENIYADSPTPGDKKKKKAKKVGKKKKLNTSRDGIQINAND